MHTPRKAFVVAGLVAALALPLAGCSSDAGSGSAAVSVSQGAAAAAAPEAGAALSAADFAAALKRPGTTILDVRTPAEFAQGHLPGAVNVDWEGADFLGQIAAYTKDAPYALYCRSGNRSGQAVAAMKGAGFTGMFHLDGGITAWSSAGGEVVTG